MERSAARTLHAVRRALQALLALGLTGMLAELLLSKHTDGALQLIPVMLLAVAIVLMVLRLLRPARGIAGAFQALCVLSIASGLVGSILHYRAKMEFALERDAGLKGWALFEQALFKGTNPPLLAPGAMIALGGLGLIWILATSSSDTTTGEPS